MKAVIYLYDDKLVLTFNYKDGTRTITLDDVKEAVKNNTGSDLDCLGAPAKQGTPQWGALVLLNDGNRARTHPKWNCPMDSFSSQFKNRLPPYRLPKANG